MASRKSALISVCLAAVAVPAAAAPAGGLAAQANAALATYPRESLARGEQGIVLYHVLIDPRGHPTECEVTTSSGFPRLDTATCQMLMDRAVFTPAENGRGRHVRSSYDGKVIWRIS
jgi:TonB family protein